ncbi:MAG: transposase [Acidiferrobacter sp.]
MPDAPRHTERLAFLRQIDRETSKDQERHLICDNTATHKYPNVQAWLAKHPRIPMRLPASSAPKLNRVERSFRHITTERLRRGVFRSVPELTTAIAECVPLH